MIIIFNALWKSLQQKSQRGIPLTLSIENVDKKCWKWDGENSRWGCKYMTEEHRNAITLSAMEGWKNGRLKRTIKELSQFDNKSQRSLSRSLTILMRLIRIQLRLSRAVLLVDLDFMYKQLLDVHKPCNTTLSLTQYQRERLISFTSILCLSLQNYNTVTMIKTSIYDVNVKCAVDTYSKFLLWVYLQVRIILCKLILFLSELDIYWTETRNKRIIWKYSSANDNIKSKFVSVVIPPRKCIIKRYCRYIIDYCLVDQTPK